MHVYCIDDARHTPRWCATMADVKAALNEPGATWIKPNVVVFLFVIQTDKAAIVRLLNGEPLLDTTKSQCLMRDNALAYWVIGPRGGLKRISFTEYRAL